MAVLTLANLQSLAASYIDGNKIMIDKNNYAITRETISKLVVKIGKQVMHDSDFRPILPELEAEELRYGTTIEEWFVQLEAATDYVPDGGTTLAPARATFKDPYYSTLLGRKSIKVTIDDTEYQKAMLGGDELAKVVGTLLNKLWQSYELHKNQMKRQLLGMLIDKVVDGSVATQVIPLAKPVDTTTGEAFAKRVKQLHTELTVFENTKFNMEEVIAQSPSVNLYLKGADILPVIDVDVLAGAFNKSKAEIPVFAKQVKDFGTHTEDANVWGMLIDPRGAKIYPHQITTTSQHNAQGEFTNYYIHFSITAYISPFTNAVLFTTTGV